jgi:hypothetical protein
MREGIGADFSSLTTSGGASFTFCTCSWALIAFASSVAY